MPNKTDEPEIRFKEHGIHGEQTPERVESTDLPDKSHEFEKKFLGSAHLRQVILDTAVDAVITINAHGEILDMNKATTRLFGYETREMVGRNINMLMPEPFRSAHDGYLQRYLETGEHHIIGIGREIPALRKDGSIFPGRLSVGVAKIDDEMIFTGIISDISDLKKTQEDLRLAKEKAEKSHRVQTEALAALIHDLTQPLKATQLYRELLAETIGKILTKLKLIADSRDRLAEVVAKILSGDADGDKPLPLLENLEKSLATLKIMSEQSAEASQADNGVGIPQITLKSAADNRDRLAKIVAKILSAETVDEEPVPLLDNIDKSLTVLQTLVIQLREISKLDVGTTVPRITNFSLAPVLAKLDAEFRIQAEQNDLELIIAPSDAIVRSDEKLLFRILQNFLSNALKYTDDGTIILRCLQMGDKIMIEVEDTGVGIPPDKHQEIFEDMVQLNNPQHDTEYGYGLGLAIVKRLSECLGTPVTVRSEEGQGSVFAVEIPAAAEGAISSATAEPESESGELADETGTVLIIDDTSTILDAYKRRIQSWGYRVVSTQTELGASVAIQDIQLPVVILADYELRKVCNGGSLIERLREELGYKIPAILITAETNNAPVKAAEELGILLLDKLVDTKTLRQAIAHLFKDKNS